MNITLRTINFAAVGLLAASLGAVGCSESTLIAPPADSPPTFVDARIEVVTDHPTEAHTMDFGEVYAGEEQVREVTVRNIGTDTLTIQSLELSNNASFEIITQPGEYAVLLTPDTSTVIQVSYNPVQDEHIEGTLVVSSNDRETPQVPVRLLAEGLAPNIDIQPPFWDFGNHELGCVGQIDITVTNIGRAPLELDEIWYEDLGGGGELTLIHSIPEDGLSLNPTEQVVVQVHYVPTDVEPDSGVLHVTSNDPSSPEATAQQTGLAHLGAPNTDEFLQEGDNSTDILFTVDNSCSMSDEQSALAVNFASFLQIVEALDIDYHLGVATTDVGDAGWLQGTVPIITPSTPDPGGTFSANVNLGVNGAGIEQGFHSAYMALDPSLAAAPGGPNDGFVRESAGLRIIFVSDEQEQSGSAPGSIGDATAYTNWFVALKPNPEHVVVSDITGGLAGCTGAGGNASSGSDYVLATTLSNGISASICDPNWVSTLSALAWLSQSFADTFELSQTPVEDTIEVRLNTVPVYVGWIYDSALNAVVFDATHVPENGDGLEIEYTVLGDCQD